MSTPAVLTLSAFVILVGIILLCIIDGMGGKK